MQNNLQKATLGGGCFWCLEAVFQRLKGVKAVESGYAGGKTQNPTYEDVCSGDTNHAEVIQITFDPNETTFAEIIKVFFYVHDPTTLNKQGNDEGTQYRSIILYHDEEQKKIAGNIKEELDQSKHYKNPIVTEISPLTNYAKAEKKHQNFYNDQPDYPYCAFVVKPKLDKFFKLFKDQSQPSL